MRFAFVAFLYLAGLLAAAVSWAPAVSADCHCTYVGCYQGRAAASTHDDERDTDDDGWLTPGEMGPCDIYDEAVIIIEDVTNGTSAAMAVSGGAVALGGEGTVFVASGQDVTMTVSFRTFEGFPHLRGNVTFAQADGLVVEEEDPLWDTAGDNVAMARFRIDEDASGEIAVPYIIEVDDGDTVTGSVPLTVRDIEVGDVDLLTGVKEDDGPFTPGLPPVVLAAALVALAVVLRRRFA